MKRGVADLRSIATRLAEVLGPSRCLLVGALAVAVHGYPHATDHVELLTSLDLKEVRKLLRAQGIDTWRHRRNAVAERFPSVQGALEATRFEILPAMAREAARAYRLEDELDLWLKDPRTRSQVEEELRARGAEGCTVLKQLAEVLPKPS